MKPSNVIHRITFMHQGDQYDACIYLLYRATRQRMNRYLYQLVIDEGMKLSDVYDVQFFVDGQELKPSDGGARSAPP